MADREQETLKADVTVGELAAIDLKIAELLEPVPPLPDARQVLDATLMGLPLSSPRGAWTCACQYEKGDLPAWFPNPFSTEIHYAWMAAEVMRERGYSIQLQAWSDSKKWLKPEFKGQPYQDWKMQTVDDHYNASMYVHYPEADEWLVAGNATSTSAAHALCLTILEGVERAKLLEVKA